MARDEIGRWALENINLDTGESVRYMETPQEFVADLLSAKSNDAFAKSGRNFKSVIVRIDK